MKFLELTNGAFHLVISAAYTMLCVEQHVLDVHALAALGTAGVGVCLIMGCLKGGRRRDDSTSD